MSNNDKAKQKLMESMRMTKAGSDKKIVEVDTEKNTIPQDDNLSKNKKKNTTTKKAEKATHKLSQDPYQSVRRVWPD